MNRYQRPPEPPQGHGPEAIWMRQFLKYVEGTILRSVKGAKVIPDARGGYHLVIPDQKPSIGGGSSKFPWQNPRELDPTVAVPQYTFVYVSPQNPIVTAGLVDLASGNLTPSRPGIWQALRAIPVKTGAGKYNVPQVPYPGSGAVAGSPLNGDADSASLFLDFVESNALLLAFTICDMRFTHHETR